MPQQNTTNQPLQQDPQNLKEGTIQTSRKQGKAVNTNTRLDSIWDQPIGHQTTKVVLPQAIPIFTPATKLSSAPFREHITKAEETHYLLAPQNRQKDCVLTHQDQKN